MDTIIEKVSEKQPNIEALKQAGAILRGGGLVAFPTETVYGLGASAFDSQAAKKIYQAKGRPSDNPLIVHIAEPSELSALVREIPETAKRFIQAFWPGPLTIVLKKSERVPYETTGGLDTVAVRMPNHPIAKMLIQAAGVPIAAPSANVSGRPSPTKAEHVIEDMNGRIDMIIDGGAVGIGLESTIVDVTETVPVLLRPGFISVEMLRQYVDKIQVDQAVWRPLGENELPKAPGMKYRHYAPKASLIIVEGEKEKVRAKINALAREQQQEGQKAGILCTKESNASYTNGYIIPIGHRDNQDEVAHNLYNALRMFDEVQVNVIYSESFRGNGLGEAIMNRLMKAAGYHVIQV